MRFGAKARKALVTTFVAGIGTVGIQDVDADGSTDFTRRGRGAVLERPVQRDGDDDDAFCVLDIETTGFLSLAGLDHRDRGGAAGDEKTAPRPRRC